MSSLYKRKNSPKWMWSTVFKGKKIARSTKMTSKTNAKKVQAQWDLNLIKGETEFLGINQKSKIDIAIFFNRYLNFVQKRKTEDTFIITRGVLSSFKQYLNINDINEIDEITVVTIDNYLDQLEVSPKTKKNYHGILRILFKQAIKEGLLTINPTIDATLPKIVSQMRHRLLEPSDLEIILKFAGPWYNYYQFLLHTGLRAGDVALLKIGNIDIKKKAIISFIRKSRRIHEFPLAECLLDQIPNSTNRDDPLFPKLYAESEMLLSHRIKAPRLHMQSMLKLNDRPKANLQSFRVTFNNMLRDLGLNIGDRQILLAHASSETTKIYTHPNFELASKFVNRIPVYNPSVVTEND